MTIKLNVIGDPIEHSKSPEVHGSILNILKIPYEYEKVKVKKNELDKSVSYTHLRAHETLRHLE